MARIVVVLVALQLLSAEAILFEYPKLELGPRDGGDPGKPLFLTPFVQAGNITEARRLARVPLTDTLNITSYAGFFTVNKTYDSNQFFWYFPALNSTDENAPVMVWLEGGPGGSSMLSLFFQHGPLRVHNETFEKRNYTWALSHHMIYIDNPVGAGFSFTEDPVGYCTDEVQVGEELYATVTQFFQLFPELQSKQFYITGESYGGKYAPALAYTIHKKNPTARVKINLRGIAIGNGLSDPEHQLQYGKYMYQLGLLDWNQVKVIENEYEREVIRFIKQQQWKDAADAVQNLKWELSEMIGFYTLNNYLHSRMNINIKDLWDFSSMIQRTSFRSSIHVGESPFHEISMVVYKHMQKDIMQSVAPWISELLDHYRIVVYNGQLDIIVPYPLTVNYLRKLNFTGSVEYETASRHIWQVEGDVAGYVKQAGNLTEIMVRNAGHSVSLDQPKWALDLITKFTHEKSFY